VKADVLVIGGGMAGCMAALAASAGQARVVLVRRSPGATALSSGAVGVAPDTWSPPGEPFASRLGTMAAARRIAASRPEHPYAAVGAGLERLDEALGFAAGRLAGVIAPPAPRPLFIPTPYGAAMSCGLAQRTMVTSDIASARGVLAVVEFRGHLGFDATLVAGGLARYERLGAPRAEPVAIDLFMREDASVARPHELARALEAPGAAEEAGRLLRRVLPNGAGAALFPPVLGLSPDARVMERIAETAGVSVGETLADVPSVPGLRLQAALDASLAAAGVLVVVGEVTRAIAPGEPAWVGERDVLAGSWVLASGRFVGGGIVRRGRLEETLLGIPVQASEDGESGVHLALRPPASLTSRERRAPQPLMAAGVRVDHLLRPLDAHGAPVHPRLFGAGAVIGGHEAAGDGTGLGTAILTGYLAGGAAAAG